MATILLCLLAALAEGYDLQTAGVAAPRLGPELDLNAAQMSWFFSSSTFGLLFGAIIGGRLADRVGRKQILVAAMLSFGAFSLLTGMALTYPFLIAARFLTGLGLGAALPNFIALIAEVGSAERRAARVTAVAAVMPIGAALCGAIALIPQLSGDWRAVFQAGGWAPILIGVAMIPFLPESAAFLTAQKAGDRSHSSVAPALFGEGRARVTLLLWTSFILTSLILYLLINWLPSLLISRGYTRGEGTLVSLAFNLSGAMGGVILSRLMTIGTQRLVIAGAYFGVIIGALLLARIPHDIGLAIGAGIVLGFFINGVQFLLYGLSPTFYEARIRGTGVGAAVSAARLGAFAGPLLAGALLASGADATTILLAMLPITVVALLSCVALMGRRPTVLE
jgi:AAHS family 3-hydroxyphenylpropionic acid transporter